MDADLLDAHPGRTPLPAWADLDEAELDSCFDDLSIIDVLPHNGTHLFRIHDHGKNVGAMFVSECAGKLLAETLPDATRAATLETYEYATAARLPIFTVSEVPDAQGRAVLYERLLLPFSDSGKRVTRILAFSRRSATTALSGAENCSSKQVTRRHSSL